MSFEVVNGATCSCSFGDTPAALKVLPVSMVNMGKQPGGTIMDFAPMVNVGPFGKCSSLANPIVLAASIIKASLDPQPCIPVTVAPWVTGALKVKIKGMPALSSTSQLMCAFAGSITISDAAQTKVNVT